LVTPASAKNTAAPVSQPAFSVSRKYRKARIVPSVNTREYGSSRMKREKYARWGEIRTRTA